MTDLNKVLMVGRLTKDINIEYTTSGMAVGKSSIAVNRSQKKNGNWEDSASFFDIAVFGKLAENLKPYLTKGKQIAIGGYLKQDRWTGQDGQNRSKVYIGVEELQLCGGKENGGQVQNDDYGFDNGANSYGY